MSPLVLTLVLLAAVLHAGWNAILKLTGDRLVAMALLAGSSGLVGACLIPFFAVPQMAAWPYIAVTSFIHLGYMGFLTRAYAHGDFGQVYPIARGAAPLVVALVGTVVFGEQLLVMQWLAILLITGGIISLAVHGLGSITHNLKGVTYALITAGFIAAYTIVDAAGARLSGDVNGFAAWLFLLHGIPLFVITAYLRGNKLWASVKLNWRAGLVGGVMSFVAYWIVLWAVTIGAVAPVAALRETSVIFASLIAVFHMKEGVGWSRIAAACVVALGVYLLATA